MTASRGDGIKKHQKGRYADIDEINETKQPLKQDEMQ